MSTATAWLPTIDALAPRARATSTKALRAAKRARYTARHAAWAAQIRTDAGTLLAVLQAACPDDPDDQAARRVELAAADRWYRYALAEGPRSA